jgi:CheY-like chemotaxis protein/nitrogen-specific signal transduction histidine kinase
MSENNQAEDYILRVRELEAENKRLEKELQKSKEKNQNSEKLKSAFLANMSHAIRTPMNAIIGFSELIGMDTISPTKKSEFVKIINEKGHQLLGLIDDIIEISKIESGKFDLSFTSINLDEFLNEIYLSVLHKKFKQGKDHIEFILEKNSQDDYTQIYTDPGRLLQIINNLLDYSIRSTTRGTIRFGYIIKENKHVEFFVKDTSIGLNKEDQRLIFDYFWQFEDVIHQRITGSGLGLSISKSLIELLGGKVWLHSELNQGTEFYFTLPIEKTGKSTKLATIVKESTEHGLNKTDPQWKNRIILVVEDDLVNYQFIEALLEKSQVQLLHATNGDQALDLCRTIHKIDLILMDLKLPEKNGYEITKEIKALRSDIPIIAQTAFPLSEVREKCLKSGCEDVVSKPIEIELFLDKINMYLSK